MTAPNELSLTVGMADGDDIVITISGYTRGMNVIAAMNALSWPEYQDQVLAALAAHGDPSVADMLQQAAQVETDGHGNLIIEPDQ